MGIGSLVATGLGAAAGLLGSGGSDPAVSGFDALPRQVKRRLQETMDKSIRDFGQGPQEFFPGQTFADLNPTQLSALQQQLAFAQNQLPGQISGINQSFGNALNAGSIFNDPSVQAGLDTIESRAGRNFSENVLPQLRQQATGTGNQFSSKAEQSERLAGRDLQQAISDAQGSFLGNQLGSARALQANAIGQAPNIAQLGLLPGSTAFGVGSQFQNQENLGITEDINRFNFGQQADDANLNQLIQRLSGLAGVGGSSSLTPTGGVNPIAGALGGATIGNSLFNSIAPSFGSTGGGVDYSAFGGGGGNFANAIQPGAGSFWDPQRY